MAAAVDVEAAVGSQAESRAMLVSQKVSTVLAKDR